MAEQTFFQLPIDPEEFGVVLTPPNLRRIDYSALEFQELQQALVEYLKTYFPDRFNDFVPHNGVIMFGELVSFIGDILAQRTDVIADENFFPTALTEEAAEQHLFLINNSLKRATPAVVDVEVSIATETALPINIPAGLTFNILGSDGNPLVYELYRAPNDFTNPITIFPGTRGIIAFGLEGQFATPYVFESAGGPNQTAVVFDSNILEDPIIVEVASGDIVKTWRKIDTLERAEPNGEVYQVRFSGDRAIFKFGDDVAGKALLAGQVVTIRYRTGGGRRGRIQAGAINESRPIVPVSPATAPVTVLFRNPSSSVGGYDRETLTEAKLRAPKESATLQSAVSGEDYVWRAKNFSHPVYGSVLKAVATVKTSLNANIVFLHVLAAGSDDLPVLPSVGLKTALETHFADLNIFTYEIRAVDAAIKPVNVKANVIISRGVDPSIIKERVTTALTDFFSPANFELGQPLYVTDLHSLLRNIDGVKYVQLREPVDDIIKSKEGAETAPDNQVGFDELITLGDLQIKIYGEKTY